MGIKDIAKKGCAYIGILTSVASALFSSTASAETIERKVASGLRPMQNLEETTGPTSHSLRERIIRAKEFLENRVSDIPKIYADWYLADLLMVLVHEQGHFDEALRWGIDPALIINPSIFYSEGRVHYDYINEKGKNSIARAKIAIAGVVNTSNLAENLKRDILLGNTPPEGLRFISMLALASELNLPYLIVQDYRGTTLGGNDIETFSQNTGISPETMAISSGIHLLVNAPYIYHLAKNVLGSVPSAPKDKDYFVSFRYNGDSYMLTFHSDLNTIAEKLPKPRFMLMHGEN